MHETSCLWGHEFCQDNAYELFMAKFMENTKLGGNANVRCLCVLDAR